LSFSEEVLIKDGDGDIQENESFIVPFISLAAHNIGLNITECKLQQIYNVQFPQGVGETPLESQ